MNEEEFDDSPCPHTGEKTRERSSDGTVTIWCDDCGRKV